MTCYSGPVCLSVILFYFFKQRFRDCNINLSHMISLFDSLLKDVITSEIQRATCLIWPAFISWFFSIYVCILNWFITMGVGDTFLSIQNLFFSHNNITSVFLPTENSWYVCSLCVWFWLVDAVFLYFVQPGNNTTCYFLLILNNNEFCSNFIVWVPVWNRSKLKDEFLDPCKLK